LVVNTYDEVRRAVHYLRWREGDAEEIAPSLYSGRRRRSKRDEDSEQDQPQLPASDLRVQQQTQVGTPTAHTPDAAEPKLPGGSPFTG